MTQARQRQAAKEFADFWKDRGDEKQETSRFWIELLGDVLGIVSPARYIEFEKPVKLRHTGFIDAYISSTKVLIEQKGSKIDLAKPQEQSDGAALTPYQQAKRYADELPYDLRPRWIVVSNFAEIHVHDMNQPHAEPEVILLENLEKELYRLQFLVDSRSQQIRREEEVSLQAGILVGRLYDALIKEYINPDEGSFRSLNILCVRLVFCFYAEDAGLFETRTSFEDYIKSFSLPSLRDAFIKLFKGLDTELENRDKYDTSLRAFPYVNGGLFAAEDIEIPGFTQEIVDVLVKDCAPFNWAEISPTIFGAVFESTLNPDTRRTGGMHYTSIENIHKVIDPLFMDALLEEYDACLGEKVERTRKKKLEALQDRMARLTFLDPACGSGNFLTETYISLRRLENRIISQLYGGQAMMGAFVNPIKVGIHQFYGIEINDFAVTVATTALWIAEAQMMAETERIVQMDLDFLPLKSYTNIAEGNALRIDWESVVPKEKLNYIMGNPPFVGYSLQSKEQKEDILSIYRDEKGKPYKTAGKIDYVAGWYWKAASMMQGTNIRTALVSTNSICQGEQVASIWEPLYKRFGIHIDFAHRTFQWDSEASIKAHVHCVIVGFSVSENPNKRIIFEGERVIYADNINPYLIDASNIFIYSSSKPICDVPQMLNGGKPTEGGFLILTEEEKDSLLQKNPIASKFIRPYMMGKDFILRKTRYCLWMVHANPADIRQAPLIVERINQVRQYRLASPKVATQKKADTPMLFDEVRECTSDYIAIPKVSSENRRYIPIDYLPKEIIPRDKLFMLPSATYYTFGILTSNVHMAWMRAVCGRLEMRYSYSNTIVYNNFPWPEVSELQRKKIEQTAQAILDARALYPDSSLADLYDEVTMPPELRRAHQQNDRAVMEAYGFPVSRDFTESDCVARLFELYQKMVGEEKK